MDIHKNARLTPRGREHMVNMVLGGQTPQAVAAAVGVLHRPVEDGRAKWAARLGPAAECAGRGVRQRSTFSTGGKTTNHMVRIRTFCPSLLALLPIALKVTSGERRETYISTQ